MANGLPKAQAIPPEGMDTTSPEWKRLCLGYHLLNMDSSFQQTQWLDGWERRNGKDSRNDLETLLREMTQWWTGVCSQSRMQA